MMFGIKEEPDVAFAKKKNEAIRLRRCQIIDPFIRKYEPQKE